MTGKKPEILTVDVETLKSVVGLGNAWLKRLLITVLVGNIALFFGIAKGLVIDHFTINNLQVSVVEHSEKIEKTEARVTKVEKENISDGVRLNNLEQKVQK